MGPVDETRDPELTRLITHFSDTKAKVEQWRDNFQCKSSLSEQSLTDEESIVNDMDPGVTQEVKTIATQEMAEVARQIKSQTASVSVSEFLMKGLTKLTNWVIELIEGDSASARTLFMPSSSSSHTLKRPKMGGLNNTGYEQEAWVSGKPKNDWWGLE